MATFGRQGGSGGWGSSKKVDRKAGTKAKERFRRKKVEEGFEGRQEKAYRTAKKYSAEELEKMDPRHGDSKRAAKKASDMKKHKRIQGEGITPTRKKPGKKKVVKKVVKKKLSFGAAFKAAMAEKKKDPSKKTFSWKGKDGKTRKYALKLKDSGKKKVKKEVKKEEVKKKKIPKYKGPTSEDVVSVQKRGLAGELQLRDLGSGPKLGPKDETEAEKKIRIKADNERKARIKLKFQERVDKARKRYRRKSGEPIPESQMEKPFGRKRTSKGESKKLRKQRKRAGR